MTGQTIGHYKIVAKLGEGGMGEVYRAKDATLGRTVALKFLAAHLLHDSEAKQRFLHEARAAAALHHPNICTVFEVAEEDGKTFLAMAYLEGESLEDRIARGPLPLKEAFEIGRQIAEGLEAAHEKGVVHRDIKPANVMVDTKGRATILDFGLARLTEASKLTRADQTLGTMAYMSPEQVQGAEVGPPTDVWALGCTLYEMVAGVRPFKGQYDQALAYEILNEEPEPLTSVRSGVPMELELLVAKCLAKDPDDRYSHADEIARDLRRLADKLRSGRSTILKTGLGASQASRLESAAASAPTWTRQASWAVAAALGLALAALSWLYFRDPPRREAIAAEFTVSLPGGARPLMLSLSPDGRHIAVATFAGKKSLWVRPLDSPKMREIPSTEGATFPFWSPDSRFLGFFADGKLKKVALAGGPPVTLCDAPSGRGGSWGPDGTILFSPGPTGGIQLVREGGGQPVAVTSGNDEGNFARRFPEFLPDGRHFLYSERRGPEGAGVYLGSLNGVAPRRLLPYETNVSYVPPFDGGDKGHLLLVRDNALMAQPFDAGRLALAGDPFPVVSRVTVGGDVAHYLFSASRTGVLAHSDVGAYFRSRQLAWVARDGRPIETLGDPGWLHGITLSPNAQRAALSKRDQEIEESDLWLIELSRKTWTRFTTETQGEVGAVWSPDGETIAYSRVDGAQDPIQLRSAGGARPAQPAPGSTGREKTWDWSPDGRWLLIGRRGVGGKLTWDYWALSVAGDDDPFAFLTTEFEEGQAQFSPDGAWVAYTSDKSGRDEIYLRSFPTSEGEWKVSSEGGQQPRWRGDGEELYYVTEDGTLTAAAIRLGDAVEVGSPEALFAFSPDSAGGPFSYDVDSDGERFLMLLPVENALEPALTVTTDWLAKARS